MKIRVLLIRPPLTKPLSDIDTMGQSLGLAYLAAVLEKESFPVKIIDTPVLGYQTKEIIKEAKKFKPTIIGLSFTTREFPAALKLAPSLKKHFQECFIIIGGPHSTVTPKKTVRHQCFDFAVLGEGEKTIIELVKALEKGKKNLKNIKGIAFKKGRKIIITPPRPFIKNLDALPFPARHLLSPLKKYRPAFSYKNFPIGTIITSRGCPFHCTFCARNVFGNQVRFRSPKNVVDEIEILVKEYGAREIRVWDDTLNLDPQRVIEICKEILKRKLVFPWACQARVNFVNSRMLGWMKKAGCWQISYGIESGNQTILNKIKKGLTLKIARQAVNKTKRAGIEAKCYFMLGLPGETEETMQDTINFAKNLDPDIATFCITLPFPGTEIYQEAIKTGEFRGVSFKEYLYYDTRRLPFIPKGLTAKKIVAHQRKAYREFYLRPKIFLRELLKIRNLSMFQAKIKGFLSVLSVQTKTPS